MDSTIRLLLIACPPELNSALEDGGVELHLASRPAEALRRFDTLSPDGVMVGIGRRPEQAALMVQALRDRPLGSLVPIVLIDRGEAPAHPLTTPSGAAEAGADRYFAPGTPAASVLASLAEMLGIEVALPEAPAIDPIKADLIIEKTQPTEHHPQEPIEPPGPDHFSPNAFDRHAHHQEPVTPDIIRRKVRQARHEDYFTLLDIRKGVDDKTIEDAYRRLRSRFEHSRLPRTLADRHYHDLSELCDAIDDAFAVLADASLRDSYLRQLLESGR